MGSRCEEARLEREPDAGQSDEQAEEVTRRFRESTGGGSDVETDFRAKSAHSEAQIVRDSEGSDCWLFSWERRRAGGN